MVSRTAGLAELSFPVGEPCDHVRGRDEGVVGAVPDLAVRRCSSGVPTDSDHHHHHHPTTTTTTIKPNL